MRSYDYSFLKNLSIPINFLSMTNTIFLIKQNADLKKENYPDIFTALEKIAIVQSVKCSNEIEGIITTDKRIEEIVNKSSAPLNHNEQEIAGYSEALKFIHENHETLDISIETILHLHKILLSKTDLEDGGKFKISNNIIREILPDGSSTVRLTPIDAKEVEPNTEELIYAYIDARDDSSINQLLLIPCFILDFLCIHPFRDGNGRMSRLLTLLMLYKNGFDVPMYVSFEEQVNKIKSSYYDSLKQSSIGWHSNNNNYIYFMENFIYSLYSCYKELDKRFLTLGSKKCSKKNRVEKVVLESIIPVSKSEIVNLLPDVSITTIEAVLSSMLKNNKIKKIGNTKNTRYLKI